jgi:cytoskeletal protein CcmA (bactofilin family)
MSGIYYRTFFSMGRVKVIKPAIQDQPVTFSNITSTGNVTVQGTTTISGSLNISSSGDFTVGAITASSILMDPVEIKSADGLVIGGSDTFTTSGVRLNIDGAGNISTTGNITASANVSASGEITTNGLTNVGSTSTTLSSSFTTTLNFSTNRIMSVTTGSALSMSIDTGNSILGNVIMTDISSSVGLHLTGSEFKVLNGTFDTTKRNYVYYHYIGNDTALVTINQES